MWDAEIGSIELGDRVVEKNERAGVRVCAMSGSTEETARTSEGEVLYGCIKGLLMVGWQKYVFIYYLV